MGELQILETAEDITPEIEKDVIDCVDWFDDSPTMSTEDFIDRLCHSYGGNSYDIESWDNPASKKIMRIARAERRGRRE